MTQGVGYRMTLLDNLCKEVEATRGLQHLTALQSLRNYLNTQPVETLRLEIYRITEERHIRTLWEAGLRSGMQAAALKRVGELLANQKRLG